MSIPNFGGAQSFAAPGGIAHGDGAIGGVVHDGRHQGAPRLVTQHHRQTTAHRGHQRIGGAQVNAHGQTVLVRRRRAAGFSDLQQSHDQPPQISSGWSEDSAGVASGPSLP